MEGSPAGRVLLSFDAIVARIAAARPTGRIVRLPIERACGCVLAEPLIAAADVPAAARARRPGLAVSAEETYGAGAYAPAVLSRAVPVRAGETLPEGTDAVLPEEAVERVGGRACALAALAPGENTLPRAGDLAAGTVVLGPGARLDARSVGAALAAGCRQAAVVAPPRVEIGLSGPAAAMLRAALSARDGLAAVADGDVPPDLTVAPADGLPRLAARPIEDASLEESDGRWVLRLPEGAPAWLGWSAIGLPLLAALAGEARPRPVAARLGGRIVSAVGMTDLVLVTLEDGIAHPLAAAESPGFAALSRADGFVVIAPGSEGLPAGASVSVHRFGS